VALKVIGGFLSSEPRSITITISRWQVLHWTK